MLGYLTAIIGLAAFCGAWVLFQRWMQKLDPEQGGPEASDQCNGCSGCDPPQKP